MTNLFKLSGAFLLAKKIVEDGFHLWIKVSTQDVRLSSTLSGLLASILTVWPRCRAPFTPNFPVFPVPPSNPIRILSPWQVLHDHDHYHQHHHHLITKNGNHLAGCHLHFWNNCCMFLFHDDNIVDYNKHGMFLIQNLWKPMLWKTQILMMGNQKLCAMG